VSLLNLSDNLSLLFYYIDIPKNTNYLKDLYTVAHNIAWVRERSLLL
jgi:hypothetical protein